MLDYTSGTSQGKQVQHNTMYAMPAIRSH